MNYLKGRYYWNKRTPEGFKQAMEHFERCIGEDPGSSGLCAGSRRLALQH